MAFNGHLNILVYDWKYNYIQICVITLFKFCAIMKTERNVERRKEEKAKSFLASFLHHPHKISQIVHYNVIKCTPI